jgi:hypothetical protein
MKHALILVMLFALLSAAFAQDAAEKSRAEATRLYPELAQKDSALNKAFVTLYQQAKLTHPQSLTKPDWPLTLAREAATSLGIAPIAPRTPPPKPEIQTLDIEIIQALPNAILVNRMKAETWGSGVASSSARIGGGGGVAIHVSYSPDGEPIVVQGFTGAKGKRLKLDAYPDGTYNYKDSSGATNKAERWIFVRTKQEWGSAIDKKPGR